MQKQRCLCLRSAQRTRCLLLVAVALMFPAAGYSQIEGSKAFQLSEATIEQIHAAYKSGPLTSRQLVQMYLDRIAEYNKKGPTINSIITINPTALDDASKLDAADYSQRVIFPASWRRYPSALSLVHHGRRPRAIPDNCPRHSTILT
ncbi:MAG: hypothetical protein HYX72_07780 [Acidobacteria bacterium]|nr:hypothetical protein [Acidobacteriota bacterium]